eukprot:8940585-Pyramimonas_sp.AAC.1
MVSLCFRASSEGTADGQTAQDFPRKKRLPRGTIVSGSAPRAGSGFARGRGCSRLSRGHELPRPSSATFALHSRGAVPLKSE